MSRDTITNYIGRTGKYRVRRGWFGKCILQYEGRSPRSDTEGGGYELTWTDENYWNAPYGLIATHTPDGKCCGL